MTNGAKKKTSDLAATSPRRRKRRRLRLPSGIIRYLLERLRLRRCGSFAPQSRIMGPSRATHWNRNDFRDSGLVTGQCVKASFGDPMFEFFLYEMGGLRRRKRRRLRLPSAKKELMLERLRLRRCGSFAPQSLATLRGPRVRILFFMRWGDSPTASLC